MEEVTLYTKFNIQTLKDTWKNNKYIPKSAQKHDCRRTSYPLFSLWYVQCFLVGKRLWTFPLSSTLLLALALSLLVLLEPKDNVRFE